MSISVSINNKGFRTMNADQFLQALTVDDLVLTANRRLANYLRDQYHQLQLELGLKAWQGVAIMPLLAWVEATYQFYTQSARRILNDFQETLLWEEIISHSATGTELINIQTTAQLAKDTWNLLQQWNLSCDALKTSDCFDIQCFVAWTQTFQNKCQALDVMTRSEVLAELITLLSIDEIAKLPKQIFFVGFDDLTPSIKILQETLQSKTQISTLNLQSTDACTAVRMSFADQKEELQAMARWAANQHLLNPEAQIGCIVPNLNAQRTTIENIFSEQGLATKYNISAAKALLDYPIIQHALLILSLTFTTIPYENWSQLLRSPFIAGSQSENNARAKLDFKLRQVAEHKISLKQLVSNSLLENCRSLKELLLAFLKIKTPDSQTLEGWLLLFSKQLASFGWPSDRTLTSTEFQVVERFKKSFDELLGSQLQLKKISFNEALTLLQRLLKTIEFQPQSHQAPIQILGLLEGAGIRFDAMWVAELTSDNWPQPAAPNPFIPMQLQRQYALPHSTSDRELQFSQNVMARLQQNARNIVFSHANFEGDRHLAPSSLITQFPQVMFDLPIEDNLAQQIYRSKKMEWLCDQVGPQITSETVSGGSGIFKSQAACPFQAFAKYRLNAEPLADIMPGLAMTERGSLIHEILALLWQELKNHETLCALDDNTLKKNVLTAIDQALSELQITKPLTISSRFIAIEKIRLFDIIMSWLEIEKSRTPFEVISCEERQVTQIDKIKLHIQIDRIDKLTSGTYVIIDYKTSKPSIHDWFSDRPSEPQLPLYFSASNYEVSSILFGQVRKDEVCFKGLSRYSDTAPGVLTLEQLNQEEFSTWQELTLFWKTSLKNLAVDFITGKAAVAPKNIASCHYCHLEELCRIHHSAANITVQGAAND